MTENLTFWAVIATAVTTAFVHTFTGPDHYLPFIVLSRARHWTLRRTLTLTFVSGLGHIASAFGLALLLSYLSRLSDRFAPEWVEETRGSLAAWMLLILGVVYMIFGLIHLFRRPHTHAHIHTDGTVHTHEHSAVDEHAHIHGDSSHRLLLGWSLFIIFVLGPCEALLPILLAAASVDRLCVFCSTTVFTAVTVATMLLAVTLGYLGLRQLTSPWIERASHLLAGLMIALCGIGMVFFDL